MVIDSHWNLPHRAAARQGLPSLPAVLSARASPLYPD